MATESVRIREMLRHRSLRLLLLASLVDGTGTWAFSTVFSYVAFERTHSVAAISVALACRWVPGLICGPLAGVAADRYDRGRLMIGSAALGAVLMGVLALAVGAGLPLPLLFALSAAQAAVAAGYGPAFAASLPDVLPERLLAGANGLREVVNEVGVVAGPAVATLLLLTGQPALGIAFNALSFLVPIGVLLRLKVRSRGAGEAGANPIAEIRDGVGALVAQRTALVLVIAMSLDCAVAGITTALALPISRHIGTGSQHYGYLLIAVSLGSVLAAGLSSRLAALRRLAPVITGALLLQAVPLALVVALPHPVPVVVLFLLSGAGMIVVDLVTVTALQRDIPGDYLGRIFGMLDTSLLASLVVFTTIGGALVGWVGLSATLLVVGIGVPVIVLACVPVLIAADRRSAERTRGLEPVVALIAGLDLFAGAERPALERLAIAAQRVDASAGTVLINEGEPAEHVWLLAAGRLAVHSAAAGELPPVEAPGYVGEIGVLHERPRTATVTAAIDCELYRVTAADFRDAVSGAAVSPALLLVSGQRLARTETPRPVPAR